MGNALLVGGKPLLVGGKPLLVSGGGGGGGGSIIPSGIVNAFGYVHGQSNAGFFEISDAAAAQAMASIGFWLGATGSTGTYGATLAGSGTVSGCGIYIGVSGYPSYLTWGGDTTGAAAAAAYSGQGTNMISYINTLTSQQKANIQIIILDHGETDSTFAGTSYAGSVALGYGDKAVYKAAWKNEVAQIRAALGKTAGQLPVVIFGVTYGTLSGYAMVREAWAELAADPANNAVFAPQQTGDSTTRGDNWNSTTGLETVGSPNGGHVDNYSNLIFAARCSLAGARILQTTKGYSPSDIPSALGQGIGPQITGATLSGNTSVITVEHDGGTDLIVPLLASVGVGWTLMDGGSITAPGTLILATACARLSSTTLQVTWASAPSNGPTSCRLFYPIQGAPTNSNQPLSLIGRGCAVTDNASVAMAADGINITSAFGGYWNGNYPLCPPMATTGSGASLSATFGIPFTA